MILTNGLKKLHQGGRGSHDQFLLVKFKATLCRDINTPFFVLFLFLINKLSNLWCIKGQQAGISNQTKPALLPETDSPDIQASFILPFLEK